ncbi:replication initiation protein [Azospirillum ramasamyi]|uniref:Uncharacterized protein n=1 Tax=Azospirillum ramasamyi TaxID=682998 RepID=A0A2U9SFC1_9PROT|nr:replication initiation protein [Azospirillum ramasamyi]AWU98084.1 hypothetical protein DM194_27750 [Azospirillum ramasamyi]
MALPRDVEIDKPNDLIFSPMRISQAAVYIINAIILNERLAPTDRPEEKRIRVGDLRLIIGAEKSKNAEFLECVLDELLTTKIKWGTAVPKETDVPGSPNMPSASGANLLMLPDGTVDQDAEEFERGGTTFLQDYAYRVKRDGSLVDPERGFIKYRLSERVHQIIRHKVARTNIVLLSQRLFNGTHSFRLYELLLNRVQQEPPGWTLVSHIYELDFLRRYLDLLDRYAEFNDFSKFILKPALKEIDRIAEFHVAVEQMRVSRVVTALRLTLTRKHEYQLPLDLDDAALPRLFEQALVERHVEKARDAMVERLVRLKIGKAAAEQAVARLTPDGVADILRRIDADYRAGYSPNSKTAYLKACLKGDATPGEWAERHAAEQPEGLPEAAVPAYRALMGEFSLTDREAGRLCRAHPPEVIESNLDYVRAIRARSPQPIGKGYVLRAVAEDYAGAKRSGATPATEPPLAKTRQRKAGKLSRKARLAAAWLAEQDIGKRLHWYNASLAAGGPEVEASTSPDNLELWVSHVADAIDAQEDLIKKDDARRAGPN